jgi:hypothetical protein
MGSGILFAGAGAASGLETLLARERAEEQLRNAGLEIGQRDRQLDLEGSRQGEQRREFDALGPSRDSEVDYHKAATGHLNAEAGALGAKSDILRGLLPMFGAGGNVATPGYTSGGSIGSGGTGGVASPAGLGGGVSGQSSHLDTPSNRLAMSVAGITPSNVFPSDGHSDLTRVGDAFAKSKYGPSADFNSLSYDDIRDLQRQNPTFQQGQVRIDLSRQGMQLRQDEQAKRQQKVGTGHQVRPAEARPDSRTPATDGPRGVQQPYPP